MARPSLPRIGRPLRAYADTSVFGGLHDSEFREATAEFFAAVGRGDIVLLVSPATADEINAAPEAVQATFLEHRGHMELVANSREATALAEAYLRARVVRPAAHIDALHVATASVARADVLVRLELQGYSPTEADPWVQRRESGARIPLDRDPNPARGQR